MKYIKGYSEIFEEWNTETQDWMNDVIREVRLISSTKEMRDWMKEKTMGYMMPLNPTEPLRSILKEKLVELSSDPDFDSHMRLLLSRLDGGWQQISIPPGAVF
jgi:hypothetical protein